MENLTKLYPETDTFLLTCVFDKLTKVSVKENEFNPLFCVSLPDFTWHCGINRHVYTNKHFKTNKKLC